MDTQTLKLNLVQQILNLSDTNLLQQVKDLLNSESLMGYEPDGTPITRSLYLQDMEDVEKQIESGTLKTYTTDEVRQQIFGKK